MAPVDLSVSAFFRALLIFGCFRVGELVGFEVSCGFVVDSVVHIHDLVF